MAFVAVAGNPVLVFNGYNNQVTVKPGFSNQYMFSFSSRFIPEFPGDTTQYMCVSYNLIIDFSINGESDATPTDLMSMRILDQSGIELSKAEWVNEFVISFDPPIVQTWGESHFYAIMDVNEHFHDGDWIKFQIKNQRILALTQPNSDPTWCEPSVLDLGLVRIKEGVRVFYNMGWEIASTPVYLEYDFPVSQLDIEVPGEKIFFLDYNAPGLYRPSGFIPTNSDKNASRVDNVFWLPSYGGGTYWKGEPRDYSVVLFDNETDSVSLEKEKWQLVAFPNYYEPLANCLSVLAPPSDPNFKLHLFGYDGGSRSYYPLMPMSSTQAGKGFWAYATSSCVLFFMPQQQYLAKGISQGVLLSENPEMLSIDSNLQPPPPPGDWRMTGVENAMTVPVEFSLLQNYPNPFNPETAIEYSLPREGLVRLAIYDLMGQLVTLLVNEQQCPGVHRVIWNAMGLPSGIYFYRLEAGNFSQTKRLVLTK
ncbi:MAG TPA: T9SS type A sorting domain-containing protein [bacterium]|nr:T9SS type A sorting domain-containing protein [bacterium]